ncbi:hypothetical protein BC829DRAFT_239165 [Chytridium lagenaria]|nr:hypothetical protein BC829DRAFT_239165 [Chytridium lagenaria]
MAPRPPARKPSTASLSLVFPPQPPKPEDPPGVCKNVEDDDQVCIDNVRYSICRSENPFLSASCGEGTICCKKNGQCLTSRQCSGEAVEIVKPVNPCSFSVDGWDTCSDNNLAVFTCKNKEVDIIRECGAGTKCCPFTRSCVTEDQCKDPCLSRARQRPCLPGPLHIRHLQESTYRWYARLLQWQCVLQANPVLRRTQELLKKLILYAFNAPIFPLCSFFINFRFRRDLRTGRK